MDAYERNRTTLRTGESFRGKHIRTCYIYEINWRHVIRKCEILKHIFVYDINYLSEMITTRGEHSSYTAIRNDQKWITWSGDRSSSNIAHSDAGRPELRYVPHGMFGNMNNMRQRGHK